MDYTTAREQHEHETLTACANIIKDIGLGEFLHRLGNYSADPHLLFVAGYAIRLDKEKKDA